jgi:ribosome biogenesis GTPase / thiamine phosphate phosphatase
LTKPGRAPADAVALLDGRVVASHGRHVDVEDLAGQRFACGLHGRRLAVVCGDEVRWSRAAGGDLQGRVYELKPRRATLERLSAAGGAEPVVANLTQLVAVAAPRPTPDWFVIDRYLAGAAWCGIGAVIALNKSELGTDGILAEEIAAYAAIGYPIIGCSTRAAPGVGALAARLTGHVSVLVGQSGTGKSSLLNALAPEARAVTQEISAATEQGRHTTTTSVLHRLASGGDLIDSPGVREYAPPLPAEREVGSGFVEIVRLAPQCRFQDCLHTAEPACAVRAALGDGRLRPRRYESYRQLVQLARESAARRPDRRPRDRIR